MSEIENYKMIFTGDDGKIYIPMKMLINMIDHDKEKVDIERLIENLTFLKTFHERRSHERD